MSSQGSRIRLNIHNIVTGRKTELLINSDATIMDVKRALERLLDIGVGRQSLVRCGSNVTDGNYIHLCDENKSLFDYGIVDNDKFLLTLPGSTQCGLEEMKSLSGEQAMRKVFIPSELVDELIDRTLAEQGRVRNANFLYTLISDTPGQFQVQEIPVQLSQSADTSLAAETKQEPVRQSIDEEKFQRTEAGERENQKTKDKVEKYRVWREQKRKTQQAKEQAKKTAAAKDVTKTPM